MQPKKSIMNKVLNLVEGSRFEKELIIFFQKSTNVWFCFNGHGYPTSYIDNRMTYMPLYELKDEEDFITYSLQDVNVTDVQIDNYWVCLLSYEPSTTTIIPAEVKVDDSGLKEGKCNLKNITFIFDGQRWYFMNKGYKIYFHSDILKTNFGDNEIGIAIGEQITFKEITGYLTKAGKYWIFILHRKAKEQ